MGKNITRQGRWGRRTSSWQGDVSCLRSNQGIGIHSGERKAVHRSDARGRHASGMPAPGRARHDHRDRIGSHGRAAGCGHLGRRVVYPLGAVRGRQRGRRLSPGSQRDLGGAGCLWGCSRRLGGGVWFPSAPRARRITPRLHRWPSLALRPGCAAVPGWVRDNRCTGVILPARLL